MGDRECELVVWRMISTNIRNITIYIYHYFIVIVIICDKAVLSYLQLDFFVPTMPKRHQDGTLTNHIISCSKLHRVYHRPSCFELMWYNGTRINTVTEEKAVQR